MWDFSECAIVIVIVIAWKKHQDAVFWVDIDLAILKGLTFYQTRSNAIILQGTLPAYCIPKVVRLKTGEVLYEKSYMSPRPPPKISLRHDHDWTRGNDELGSTVEQQPVGKIVRQSCGEVQRATFSQLTQPKPKPICDRSGRPDSTEDVFVVKGETSRSHEIDEKGFHGELGSSDRSGKPDNLSENTRVKQAHDGTGQPVERNSSSVHTVKEQFAPEEKSWHCVIQHGQRVQPCNQRGGHRLQHSRTTTFCSETITWCQRSRFDSEDREPPSSTCTAKWSSTTSTIQSFQQTITRHDSWSWEHRLVRTTRCGTQSTVQNMSVVLGRRHRLLHVWHFLRDGTEENKKFVKYTLDLLSIPNYYIKNGRPHGHCYGKKPGDHEYFTANSLKKKCKKRNFLGIHDRFIRDEKFRKNMIDNGRNEEICREMDKLANEDHTHRITEEEIRVYRNNWWIRSNIVSSDTMPVRHRADFKQALTTLRQLKNQEDTAYYQKWQSSSSSWWNWQESWWHSSSEHHRDDGPNTDWSGKPDGRWLGQLFEVWFSELIWCRITVRIR